MRLLAMLATRQTSSLRKAEAPNCFTRLTNIVVKTIRKINTVFFFSHFQPFECTRKSQLRREKRAGKCVNNNAPDLLKEYFVKTLHNYSTKA